ncbi:hypothetical protein VU12_03320 [Desulfobulbus sp. US4]|nr:hypothetical protein [Desulfobulbus sp. US4]
MKEIVQPTCVVFAVAECSAGIYDIIDIDDKIVRKNLFQLVAEKEVSDTSLDTLLRSTLFHAARMLLVTRGEEPKKEAEVYNLFTRHFLNTGLVAEVHRPLR